MPQIEYQTVNEQIEKLYKTTLTDYTDDMQKISDVLESESMNRFVYVLRFLSGGTQFGCRNISNHVIYLLFS